MTIVQPPSSSTSKNPFSAKSASLNTPPLWQRILLSQQTVLGALLLIEIIIFAIASESFRSLYNALEIIRLNVEVGLLALALTPVILTGGIDLSVGSLLGLCAILFGKLTRDAHVPLAAAAVCTLGIGMVAGGLNALLITTLRIPPLIVTLGTLSLFRGLAEGITHGTDNFNFTKYESFVFLGNGYFFNQIPAQTPVLLVAAVVFWILVHRTTFGRALVAIGFSPEGSRHAGIPVEKRLAAVYILSGFMSALAAIIYVAHIQSAKADVGTGYELTAITAVVLGGTSIFGGRGTVLGTILGLFTLAVLQNGIKICELPSELATIIGGTLLIAAIAGNQFLSKFSATRK